MWFPTSYSDVLAVEYARQVCRACPILAACRVDVLREEAGQPTNMRSGIRAALIPSERAAINGPKPRVRQTKCGTIAGFRAHAAAGEPPCTACQGAETERISRYLASQRRASCGTHQGYMRHVRNGQHACQPCRAAHSEYRRIERHAAPAA
jgi:hypothetical protein